MPSPAATQLTQAREKQRRTTQITGLHLLSVISQCCSIGRWQRYEFESASTFLMIYRIRYNIQDCSSPVSFLSSVCFTDSLSYVPLFHQYLCHIYLNLLYAVISSALNLTGNFCSFQFFFLKILLLYYAPHMSMGCSKYYIDLYTLKH